MASRSGLAVAAGRICVSARERNIGERDLAAIRGSGRAFHAYCRRNGVAPLVYRRLCDLGLGNALDAPVADRFRRDTVRVAGRNLGLLRDLEELAAVFRTHGAAPVVLKGPALMGRIYGDPALRPATDLDLLVLPEELAATHKALTAAGYAGQASCPHVYSMGATLVDVHVDPVGGTRIPGRTRAFRLATAELLARSRDLEGRAPLRRLDPLDEVLVLACHLVKHGFARLIWLVDLQRCLERAERCLLGRTLGVRADATGTGGILAFGISVLRERTGWSPGREILAHLPRRRLRPVDRLLLNLTGDPDAPQLLEPVLLAPNIRDSSARWRYLLETAFPSTQATPRQAPGPRIVALALRTGRMLRKGARAFRQAL